MNRLSHWIALLLLLVGGVCGASDETDDDNREEINTPIEVKSEYTPAPSAADWPERGALMKELQGSLMGYYLDEHRLQISGWVEGSFTASSARVSNLPMGFNYVANNFLLQQNWLHFERSLITEDTVEPTWGFRSDWILPGSDYRFNLDRGLFSDQLTANNGQPRRYGFDPIQFYGEAYFPNVGRGLHLILGRFFSQPGYESPDAISNPLCSHSYTDIYSPSTQTGLLCNLRLADSWVFQVGIVLGNDVFLDPAASLTGTARLEWTSGDERDIVQISTILGPGRYNQAEEFDNAQIFDLVWVHHIDPRLHYALEGIFGFTAGVPDLGATQWFGLVNYLMYDLTPKCRSVVRLEFFDDIQGQRTNYEGLYTALTVGLNIRPHPTVLFRPEVRFDYNDTSRPFEGRHGLFTATADLILRW